MNGNYALTSANTACISCHQTDYNNTNNPKPLRTVGFPTTCDACHSTTNWTGATFNHNATTFPLTGAHATVACANCHVNNNYTTLPTRAWAATRRDYNGTTNPNHASAGFPNTCDTCHTTTAWTGATFNHTYLPRESRQREWGLRDLPYESERLHVFQCTGCHGNNNAANFHHPKSAGMFTTA